MGGDLKTIFSAVVEVKLTRAVPDNPCVLHEGPNQNFTACIASFCILQVTIMARPNVLCGHQQHLALV